MQPLVVLADDPTKGVDVQSRREVHGIFRQLAKAGSAVLLASSDDVELVENCDRVLVMYGGRIVRGLYGMNLSEKNLVEASVSHGELLNDG